jgi:hypothetical protein
MAVSVCETPAQGQSSRALGSKRNISGIPTLRSAGVVLALGYYVAVVSMPGSLEQLARERHAKAALRVWDRA